MKRIIVMIAVLIALMLALPSYVSMPRAGTVAYPAGYRTWQHLKTAIIGPNNPAFPSIGGFHHVYANEKALEGFRTGKFPDGSILVFDVLEAVENNGDVSEGKRVLIDVMEKDNARFSATDGWGFEEFSGNEQSASLTDVLRTKCYNCHLKQKGKGFVFSEMRQ